MEYLLSMSMWGRCLVFVIACLLASFTPLVHADPPDPLFIAGYWDDDAWIPIAHVRLPVLDVIPAAVRSAVSPRAPPVAPSPAA